MNKSCDELLSLSMLRTGLDDASLLNLPEISNEMKQLVEQLLQHSSTRYETLIKLIREALSVAPTTRAEYMWHLKFTAIVILLKRLPVSFCTVQGNLLTNVFSPPTSIWDGSPLKINYFAKGIYDIFENDLNMMFVIKQIESRSTLGLYISIVMLWRSIYRCIGEEKEIFIFYVPSNLIQITAKMDRVRIEHNFDSFFNFVMLLSQLMALLFHRKSRRVEYICYEDFFLYDLPLIKFLRKFFDGVISKAEEIFRITSDIRALTIIEFSQTETTELDSLLQE